MYIYFLALHYIHYQWPCSGLDYRCIIQQMTVRNSYTNELLRQLDRERPLKPTLESVMEAPANVFCAIRQMYNSFKKDSESRILQNKVYELRIHDTLSKIDRSKDLTLVKIGDILDSVTNEHRPQIVAHLLVLKTYLQPKMQRELVVHIVGEVAKVEDLATMLRMFSKLLKSQQCTSDKQGLYRMVEAQLVAKLLAFNHEFSESDVIMIAKFLFGLPVLDRVILQSIANIFEKLSNIQDFSHLQLLYEGIYQKLQQHHKQQNSTLLLQSFVKITTEKHLKTIRQRVERLQYGVVSLQDQSFLNLLYEEAINKMLNFASSGAENSAMTDDLKEKSKKVIDFIFIALKAEAILQIKPQVSQSNRVWRTFIGWNHLHCKGGNLLEYVSIQMATLASAILEIPKAATRMINLLIHYEARQVQGAQKMVLTLDESVSQHFIRALTSKISGFDRHLNTKMGRQLVAFGLVIDDKEIYEQVLLNPNNIQTIGIILQTFSFSGVYEFYRKLLTNQLRRANLEKYLQVLLQKKPNKFKDFFIKADMWNQGQIFEIQDHFLLRYLWNTSNSQLIVSFLRDMTGYPPSKYSIDTMNTFIKLYEGKPEQKMIYSQAVRTLQVILSSRQARELTVEFKKHLKEIVESKVIGNEVFKNVPQGMIKDLAAFYGSEAK